MEQVQSKSFEVMSIGIQASPERVFDYVANDQNLPEWTEFFKEVKEDRALVELPDGEVEVSMSAVVDKKLGIIDSFITMPDGSINKSFSRVTEGPDAHSAVFSFVMFAPPVPPEMHEKVFAAQKAQMNREMVLLKQILEA